LAAPESTRNNADALRAGYDALVSLGGAQRGDKTILDALVPSVEWLGYHFDPACASAAKVAAIGGYTPQSV
jgi:phosphoenolpyruvate---glycerone phosphotransferase subunit DhaL